MTTHLLHLASIFGTQNDHFLLLEVDGHGGVGCHGSGISVGRESTGVVDDIVGVEVLQLFPRGTDEHVVHEQGMVGTRADDTHVDAVALVPASKTINDIDAVSGVEVVDSTFAVNTPDLST